MTYAIHITYPTAAKGTRFLVTFHLLAAALLATLRYPSCGSLLVTGEAARLTSWSSVLVIRPWLLIGTDLLLGLCSARL